MEHSRPTALARLMGYELKRLATGAGHTVSIDITAACNFRCTHCYFFRLGGEPG